MVIKCPNCNHYVSDTAKVCPYCYMTLKEDSDNLNESSSNIILDGNVNCNDQYSENSLIGVIDHSADTPVEQSTDERAHSSTTLSGNKKYFLLLILLITAGSVLYFISNPIKKTKKASISNAETSVSLQQKDGEVQHRNRDLTFMVGGVSLCLKYVEGGTFMMGATDEQREYAEKEEFPAHTVTLHDYYIGETEVTQELWEEVMGYNPANTIGASLPIENVSWNDCIDFIRELNRQTGKTFRLPTEAEWEYAARGGVSSCQYLYSGSDIAEEVGWIKSNCGGRTHPVGTRNPNELGIYDMTGNVCEWCQDWMSDYSSTSLVNPTGPRNGTARVGRGGGWCNSSARNRVSTRFAGKTTYRDYNLGFRIAM